MKGGWASGLTLCLGLCGGLAPADDVIWRPATPRTAATEPAVPAAAFSVAGVSLGRPLSVGAPSTPEPSTPMQDSQLRRATYWSTTTNEAPALFRAQKPDIDMLPPVDAPDTRKRPAPPADRAAGIPRTLAGSGLIRTSASVPVAANDGKPVVSGSDLCCGACGHAPLCDSPTCCGACGHVPLCDSAICCDEDICSCEAVAANGDRSYGSAEFLFWKVRNASAPVLTTSGSRTSLGILPRSGTTILFGGSELDQQPQMGGRFTGGWWCDACQTNGIEGSFFFLGEGTTSFNAASNGLPILARPFFNASTQMESAEQTAFPNAESGRIHIDAPTRLWGAELDWRHNLLNGCWYRLDTLVGFRYVDLEEGLHITEDITLLPGFNTTFPGSVFPGSPFMTGSRVLVADRFDTRNQFYGGQVGLDGEFRRNRWVVDVRTKVAIGFVHEMVDIDGAQVITPPPGGGPTQVFQGGLLALSSNIGHRSRERFAVVPEAGLTVGYLLTDHVKLFAGYNFLFMSNVVRPGDQIDRVLDPRRIPNFCRLNSNSAGVSTECPRPGFVNPPRPAFQFHETTFWAQGVTAGVELKY